MNEHRRELQKLRSELRNVEWLIREAIADSPQWNKLFEKQGRLHWSIGTRLLLVKCDDDIEAELRRQREEDESGEEWKGSDQ